MYKPRAPIGDAWDERPPPLLAKATPYWAGREREQAFALADRAPAVPTSELNAYGDPTTAALLETGGSDFLGQGRLRQCWLQVTAGLGQALGNPELLEMGRGHDSD